MKIGLLTFHWGTNYGGVLQAYALQTFLKQKGHDVAIINYAPHTFRDSFLKCFYSKNPFTILENIINYLKENNIKKFRKKYFVQTERYYTLEQLLNNLPQMDVYISGSDQVWNPYGLKNNKKIYFLPFGNEAIKIAYAASFGVIDYPDNLLEEIKPLLKDFKAISVREKSGQDIIKKAGIDNSLLVPDPTLLLKEKDYLKLINYNEPKNSNDFFFYVLQKNQKTISCIYNYLKGTYNNKIIHTSKFKHSLFGIEDWLYHIKNSKVVITNSFHGAVFSIIFNTPFIVVPIEGKLSGMNDRIITLLQKFGLMERLIEECNSEKISNLLNKPINWKFKNDIQLRLGIEADNFFQKILQ